MIGEISGKIEAGMKLGSEISYPTINIVTDRDQSLEGVYVCEVEVAGEKFFGAGYVGEKASLPEDKFICEVFLFGEVGELYGEFAKVKLLEKIRDVQKTKNLEELKLLITRDVKYAKDFLNG